MTKLRTTLLLLALLLAPSCAHAQSFFGLPGTSVNNPGTGTIEMLLPVQTPTVVANAYVVAAADLFKETRLGNGGVNFTATLPAFTTPGMVNGTRVVTNNIDATATLTVIAGSGTQVNGAGTATVGPSRSVTWILDTTPGTPTWRSTGNGLMTILSNALPASCPDTGGNHLNYTSGGGFTCGTGSSANGQVLLNTLTASSSATLSDTTSFTGTYSSYLLVFINIIPSNAGVIFALQVHSGGSFQTTNYLFLEAELGASYSPSTTPTTVMPITAVDFATGSPAAGFSGTGRVFAPSGTTMKKDWNTQGTYTASGLTAVVTTGGYWNGGNGAVDGFQVFMANSSGVITGTITSGTIKIYGIL